MNKLNHLIVCNLNVLDQFHSVVFYWKHKIQHVILTIVCKAKDDFTFSSLQKSHSNANIQLFILIKLFYIQLSTFYHTHAPTSPHTVVNITFKYVKCHKNMSNRNYSTTTQLIWCSHAVLYITIYKTNPCVAHRPVCSGVIIHHHHYYY